jgi:hypothetical protein
MPKKQSTTKKRTQVKDLPKKEKKLTAGDMKKVRGGTSDVYAQGGKNKSGGGR